MRRESDQHIPRSVEMSASFTPYHVGSYAYIHVRVPNGPRPDGSILVYLANGTALVVNDEELLHLDTGKNAPNASDDGPSSSTPHGLMATHQSNSTPTCWPSYRDNQMIPAKGEPS
jgi:hypothetical protein